MKGERQQSERREWQEVSERMVEERREWQCWHTGYFFFYRQGAQQCLASVSPPKHNPHGFTLGLGSR